MEAVPFLLLFDLNSRARGYLFVPKIEWLADPPASPTAMTEWMPALAFTVISVAN